MINQKTPSSWALLYLLVCGSTAVPHVAWRMAVLVVLHWRALAFPGPKLFSKTGFVADSSVPISPLDASFPSCSLSPSVAVSHSLW